MTAYCLVNTRIFQSFKHKSAVRSNSHVKLSITNANIQLLMVDFGCIYQDDIKNPEIEDKTYLSTRILTDLILLGLLFGK